jgi:hypothetical protein
MTRSLLLASLAAAALSVPAQAPAQAAAAAEPVIWEISVRPAAPVVGPGDSVRLVIDVVAKGVRGKQGITVQVEPGRPPGPVLADKRREPPDHAWTPEPYEREDEDITSGYPASGAVVTATRAARPVADGWQTWRFLPDKKLDRFYPAGPWTVTVTARGEGGTTRTEYAAFELRRESRLKAVRAERARGGVRISGRLQRLDPRGLAAFTPYRDRRVEILWRPGPSAAWERVATAATGSRGAFSRIVSDRRDGEWRVRYPGDARHAPDLSAVRRPGVAQS